MIIPCIDLQDGRAVQLVHGRKLRLAVDDVFGLLDRFREYPLLHVIDLDAAMGQGKQRAPGGRALPPRPMRVRVGGGIRTAARAKRMLEAGAEKIIVGSAAFRRRRGESTPFSRGWPRESESKTIIVAVDTERRPHPGARLAGKAAPASGGSVSRNWRRYASEFLCTYVDAEGTMRGTNLRWFRELREATRLPITAAGGIRSQREVRAARTAGHECGRGHGAVPESAALRQWPQHGSIV